MPVLHVISTTPGAGKSAVAVALALGLAGAGNTIQLFRTGSSPGAVIDARTFAGIDAVQAADEPIGDEPINAPPAGTIAIVEHEPGNIPATGTALLVVRGAPTDEELAASASLGGRLVGTIATLVPPGEVESIARMLTN